MFLPTATFIVTNIGKEHLLIEQANPTCGCTISDYTKSPLLREKQVLSMQLIMQQLWGIHKTLTVKFAGADDIKSIKLTGEVLEPAAYDTWAAAK